VVPVALFLVECPLPVRFLLPPRPLVLDLLPLVVASVMALTVDAAVVLTDELMEVGSSRTARRRDG
jgi:hypothetical protein